MLRNLIVGMGEIGSALRDVMSGCDVQTLDLEPKAIELPIDVLHIAFPYSVTFVDDVKHYIGLYRPEHVIVYSTVPIGTCTQIGDKVVHSPVEGRHPDLDLSITYMERWIGTSSIDESRFFTKFFNDLNLRVRAVSSPRFTEFLKLRSTAKYGINLVWTDYEKYVADAIDMDFRLVKEFDTEYNRLYKNLGSEWAQRYILDPPGGRIGGHCVVPNAKLLDEHYPHDMLKMIKEME